MEINNSDNVELDFLQLEDYPDLIAAMVSSYPEMDAYWKLPQIEKLLSIFPEGQVVIKINGVIAGAALSIIVDHHQYDKAHTYKDITANESFSSHNENGDVLYGIDIFIKPEYRGLRLGRRLYDYRKNLCEKLNLKGILFGGRIPNYHKYSDEISPKEYIEKVKNKEIHDPVLNFQVSNDFYPTRVLKNYLKGDVQSHEYAVLMEWRNIYYEKPSHSAKETKRVVRLGLIQWQMRPYQDLDALMEQIEFFIASLAGYNSDFALFPEFFNAPLMGAYNDLSEPDAIRKLANYTHKIVEELSKFAISYNINIVSGSMPEMVDEVLYNVRYLCHRDGKIERYEKLHITPNEVKVWGIQGGSEIKVFDTDCGKVGVLICYDAEFPELGRILADQGMEILFVPFLTDTQNSYSRVRHCAQARAIENECYVAIAGSVGNLPKVHNMDIQFAQSMVFTPCDFSFPTNGIKAEATPNTEMILVADVDLDLLLDLNEFGSVQNIKDRRTDLFELRKK